MDEAESSGLADDTPVAGILVDGEPRAYSLTAMSQPHQHVINDVVGARAVSVTYCDKTDCLRAFSVESSRELPLWLEGWSGESMLLSLDGQVFSQHQAPLSEYPAEKTTWGQWRQRHPTSKVFR